MGGWIDWQLVYHIAEAGGIPAIVGRNADCRDRERAEANGFNVRRHETPRYSLGSAAWFNREPSVYRVDLRETSKILRGRRQAAAYGSGPIINDARVRAQLAARK